MFVRKSAVEEILSPFVPRALCFAEGDAGDDPAAGGELTDDELAAAIVGEAEPEVNDEEQPDELEEVEYDGKKVKVTKGFKDALLRDDDYRRKTHTVAEERRAVAAEREQFQRERQVLSAFETERTELTGIDKKLAEYKKITPEQWSAYRQQDKQNGTTTVDDALFEEAQLTKARGTLLESMQGKFNELSAKAQEQQRVWNEKNDAEIKTRIKDWSPDKEKAVKATVAQTFNLDPRMLEGVKDAGILTAMDWIHNQVQALARAKDKVAKARAEISGESAPAPVRRVGSAATVIVGVNQATLKNNPQAFDNALLKKLYRTA